MQYTQADGGYDPFNPDPNNDPGYTVNPYPDPTDLNIKPTPLPRATDPDPTQTPAPTQAPQPDPRNPKGIGNPSGTDPYSYLGQLLNGAFKGQNPQTAVDYFNNAYQLGSGSSAAYYGPGSHGATDRGTIGLPNGYWALNADGSWGWNVRQESPGGTGTNDPLTPHLGGSNDPTDPNSGGAIRDPHTPGIQLGPNTPGTTGTTTGGPTDTTGGTTGSTGGGDALSQFLTQLLNRGNNLLDQYSKPVSANDPFIAPAVDAYHGIRQRQLADQRATAAERAHAEGVPTGAFDSQVNNLESSAGQDEGNLQASMMTDENQARRQALATMFGETTGATGVGINDVNTNKALDIQDFLGKGNLSNNLTNILGTLTNNRTGLNNQNQQFYDNLAFLMSQYGNNLDSILSQLLVSGGGVA